MDIHEDDLHEIRRDLADALMESEHEAQVAQQKAEIRAERMNDWIMGGGDPADAGRFAMYEEHGWPDLIDPDDGVCEHGLSASLWVGPSHYPLDM